MRSRTDGCEPHTNRRFGLAYYASETLVVNQRPLANGPHHVRRLGNQGLVAGTAVHCALALLGCALSAFAQAPPMSGIERLVATDAISKLDNADPKVRGEAALIVASTGQVEQEPRLLELAVDPAPEARQRATIALGLLATPRAINFLEAQLRTTEGRTTEDGMVAAFALGLVPADRIDTSIARTLPMFEQGSWKRQHDVLVALLLGMSRHPERLELRALQNLLQNEANRAPDVRALLLQLLLPIDSSIDERELRRILRRGSDLERLSVVRWLAARNPDDNKPWLEELAQVAQRDSLPELRSTALLALTRCRYIPALEIAAHALKSTTPDECTQAMAAMLTIGGASTHGALEQHLLVERNPARIAALLKGFLAPPSAALITYAVGIASDAKQPIATRAAAAELVSRSDKKRAAPLLRDLFRIATEPAVLTGLARALRRVEDSPTALSRLLNRPHSLTHHADRWQALLAAGHGEAQRQILQTLQDSKSSDEDVHTAVKVWRRAMIISSLDGSGAAEPLLPPHLQQLFD